MPKKIDKDILNSINSYLRVLQAHKLNFESVWLFGSAAQNTTDADSDIDLAVIMPEVENKFYKELELTRYRRGIDSRIEPHIINAADIDLPMYKEITDKGIRIA